MTKNSKEKIMIISVLGLHSSGKSVIAEYISENYGFYKIETGDFVRAFAKEKKGVVDDKTVPWAATYLFKKYKDKYITDKVKEEIEKQKKKGIKKFVISGIKTLYCYKHLDRLLGPFKQIGIVLDANIRYERAKKRDRPDDSGADSRADFNKRTWRELKQGLGTVLAISDFFVDNSGSLEQSFQQVDKIMKKLKIKKETKKYAN